MDTSSQADPINAFTCDLEEWFHILGSATAPGIDDWPGLPLRVEKNVDRLLELLAETGARATFFCLGWLAERMPRMVQRCRQAGHEIASHGYAHVLAHGVGRRAFLEDIVRARTILEDCIGQEVVGFRSPGFCVKEDNRWVFDVVAEAGYKYDASVFPAHHGHGGLCQSEPDPHIVRTRSHRLVEIPISTVRVAGRRICLFGGGYLRLAPLSLIQWGVERLRREGRPLIVYMHPREIDPDHPRLPLPLRRRFKCYVNLRGTMTKLQWLCRHCAFTTMKTVAARLEEQGDWGLAEAGVPSRRREQVGVLVGAAGRPIALGQEAVV
jgi:polysaccharide deacetylase family protein (PEP-CTERM system associated)